MEKIYYIAKIITITELIIIALLIILSYSLKIIFHSKEKKTIKVTHKINEQLSELLNAKQINLSVPAIQYFKKHILIVLTKLHEFEDTRTKFSNRSHVITQLSNDVFKPIARKSASSWDWFKRYIAALCFTYGFDPEDEKLIKQLITDHNALVSINAAKAAAKFPNLDLTKFIVNTFAQGRRLQQSEHAVILTQENSDFKLLLQQTLHETQDPYARAFCYRLLTRLPSFDSLNINIENDATSNNIELQLAALNYLAHIDYTQAKAIILKCINNPHWEVRAVAAKILGDLHDESAAPLLAESLKDREWWVRINAANALLLLGKAGIATLKAQSPQTDRYAYDAAQEALKTVSTTEGS